MTRQNRSSSVAVKAAPPDADEAVAGDVSTADVVRAYDRYAGFYDRLFGLALAPGRRAMAECVRGLAPASILEVGVGTGLTLAAYPPAARVTGIDLSPGMLARARAQADRLPGRRIALQRMDAEAMDFADASFDCVALPYVLSVTPDPAALVAEVRRVCRPGGAIVLLNHFSGTRGWKPLESLVRPLAATIGFRSSFDYAQHVLAHDWTVVAERAVNMFGLSKLVLLRND